MRYPVSMRNRIPTTTLLCGALLAGCGSPPTGDTDFAAPAGTGEPHLALTPSGDVVLSYLQTKGLSQSLQYVTYPATSYPEANESSWSTPATIISADNLLVNWADFPAVEPLTNKRWAAHWMELKPGGSFAYDSYIAFSSDAGISWSESRKINQDSALAEHGFVSVFSLDSELLATKTPATNDAIAGAIWLDGRQMARNHYTANVASGTELYSALFSSNGQSYAETTVDTLVCDCCQTDATRAGDAIVVAYRGRSTDNVRDIHSASLINGNWQTNGPVAVDGWQVRGCPVNGPAIAAQGERVAAAWYTEHPQPLVRVAFADATRKLVFEPAIDVASERPAGRVDLVMLPDGDAIVSWLQRGSGSLLVRRVATDGTLGEALEVAQIGTARRAGFPQMQRLNEQQLLFAITDMVRNDANQPQTRVRTLRQPIPL